MPVDDKLWKKQLLRTKYPTNCSTQVSVRRTGPLVQRLYETQPNLPASPPYPEQNLAAALPSPSHPRSLYFVGEFAQYSVLLTQSGRGRVTANKHLNVVRRSSWPPSFLHGRCPHVFVRTSYPSCGLLSPLWGLQHFHYEHQLRHLTSNDFPENATPLGARCHRLRSFSLTR